MATAIFLSDARFVMVGVGPFGDDVVGLLGARADARELPGATVEAVDRGFTDGARTAVLALWRPSPALCEEVDELAARRGRSWLPVVMEHPHVLVGPLVAPGGPCFRCYHNRRAQHDPHTSIRTKLEAAYDGDPDCGPAGYLPHQVRTAAGLAELTLRPGSPAGTVAQMDVLSGRTATQRVIAWHGCARCGARAGGDAGGNRALAALVPGSG